MNGGKKAKSFTQCERGKKLTRLSHPEPLACKKKKKKRGKRYVCVH